MALDNALLVAQVVHARSRPKKNRFRYHVYYLCVALNDIPRLGKLALFSLKHFNLFGLRLREYHDMQDPENWMHHVLKEWNITAADGEIILMTMPRVLNYAFNPVSFWFCLDRQGGLRAVLADVSNTFGERHAYLLAHEDEHAIGPDDLFTSEKVFHVSPFLEISGHYQFRFAYDAARIGVWIDHYDEQGQLLTTSVVGKRSVLTSLALLRCFFRYPLVTFKVIGLIHYQALRLFTKGVRYHVKPPRPSTEISR